MDRTNEPNQTGYLVCGRGREDQPMYFPTKESLDAWVNANPLTNAYCEYLELNHEVVKELLMRKGYSTMAFRTMRRW